MQMYAAVEENQARQFSGVRDEKAFSFSFPLPSNSHSLQGHMSGVCLHTTRLDHLFSRTRHGGKHQ
jgi:hypothetical protein